MKNNTNKSTLKPLTMVAGAVLTTGLALGGSANPAAALQLNFSYSGSGVNASGVLTTNDTPDSNGFLTITDITGERNGESITALLPPGSFPNDAPPFGVPNDNLVSTTEPFLSFAGFSYLVGAQPENVFFYDVTGGYAETDDPNGDPSNYRLLDTFNVQPVPEPSSASGLVVALLSGAWLLKKKVASSRYSSPVH